MADQSMLSRNPDLVRRVLVTLAVLVLYRAGTWIPLPGVDATALGSQATGERISIMALGIVPLLSALILVEMTMLIWPKLRAQASDAQARSRLDHWITVGALFLAAVQAYGMAQALTGMAGLVPDPSPAFAVGVVVSLVAATAFVIWLASLITRLGIGNGLWILLVIPHVLSFVEMLATQTSAWGQNAAPAMALSIAFLALSIAVLAALTKTHPPLADAAELPWAAILGFTAANWLLAGLLLLRWLLLPAGQTGAFDTILLSQGTLVLPIIAIALVVVLRRRSLSVPVANFRAASAMPLAVAMSGLVAAGHMISAATGLPIYPNPATFLMLAAIGLAVFDGLSGHGAATAPVSDGPPLSSDSTS